MDRIDLNPVRLEEHAERYSEEHKGVRLLGGMGAREGLVFPNFKDYCVPLSAVSDVIDINVHYDRINPRFKILVGIDPSDGKARYGIVLAAYDPKTDITYYIDSDFTETSQNTEKCVRSIGRMLHKWGIPTYNGIHKVIMDTAGPVGKNAVPEYCKWAQKLNIKAEKTGYGVIAATKQQKTQALDRMSQAMDNGKVIIVRDHCEKLVTELSYLQFDIRTQGKIRNKGYQDCVDAFPLLPVLMLFFL